MLSVTRPSWIQIKIGLCLHYSPKSVPSDFIMQVSHPPNWFEENAIIVPSGEKHRKAPLTTNQNSKFAMINASI